MSWYTLLPCENPRDKEHVTNFVKKYPTAQGRVPKTLILVDPKDWAPTTLHNNALVLKTTTISSSYCKSRNPFIRMVEIGLFLTLHL